MNADTVQLNNFVKTELSEIMKNIEPASPLGMSTISKLYDMILKSHRAFHKNAHMIQETELKLLPKMEPRSIISEIPASIRNHINSYTLLYKQWTFSCNSRNCIVHMYYPTEDPSKKQIIQRFFKNAIYKIYLWVHVSSSFTSKSCPSIINMHFYFTDFKKTKPNKKKNPLDIIHLNTAFATGCEAETTIHLFRKEEWFKVFIHKTFHVYGFDFSNMDCSKLDANVRSLFPIVQSENSEFRLYEAYVELWADVINILFLSAVTSKTKAAAMQKFSEMLKREQAYSLYQCSKILNHYDLSYANLLQTSTSHTYIELSYAFSYFVIRSMLFVSWNKFIIWCHANNKNILQFNKTQPGMNRFFHLVDQVHLEPRFLEALTHLEQWWKTKRSSDSFVLNNMRMTVYG
jgi:hypothetical protein